MSSVRETMLDTLEQVFRVAVSGSAYQGKIAAITRWRENKLNLDNYRTPFVAIHDSGRETVLVDDGTDKRLALDIEFYGFVASLDARGALSALNEVAADIKKFLDSSPSFGTSVLRIRYVSTDHNAISESEAVAACQILARLTYVVERGVY
jgi:hypothetical protein